MGVRPQLLELLYLAATLLVVDAWLDGRLGRWSLGADGRWRADLGEHPRLLPLLLAVLAVVTVAALVGRERRWSQAAVAVALAAVVPLLNPWGLQLYAFAVQSLTSDVTGRLVEEWRPPTAPGALLPALHDRRRRRGHRRGASCVRRAEGTTERRLIADLLMALAFLVLALRSGRHVMLFGIAAAPLLAAAFAAVGRGSGRGGSRVGGPATADRRRRHRRPRLPRLADATSSISSPSSSSLCAGRRRLAAGRPDFTSTRYRDRATRWRSCLPSMTRWPNHGPDARSSMSTPGAAGSSRRDPSLPVFIDGRSEV